MWFSRVTEQVCADRGPEPSVTVTADPADGPAEFKSRTNDSGRRRYHANFQDGRGKCRVFAIWRAAPDRPRSGPKFVIGAAGNAIPGCGEMMGSGRFSR